MSAKYDPDCPQLGRADNDGLLYRLEDLQWDRRLMLHGRGYLVPKMGAVPVQEFTHPDMLAKPL